MKNLILGMCLLVSFNMLAQTDSIFIYKSVDDMSGEVYEYVNKKMLILNSDKTVGFTVKPMINKGESYGLAVMHAGLGTCSENDVLIIKFDDDSKVSFRSFNKFNCKGNSYFIVNEKEEELLASKKIAKIRFTNGESYKMFEKEIDGIDKDYFIMYYEAFHSGTRVTSEE